MLNLFDRKINNGPSGWLSPELSGKSIYLAIIIAFVAAMFAFLFLLSRFYRSSEMHGNQNYITARDNLLSAVRIGMQNNQLVGFNEHKEIDLYSDNTSLINLKKKYWGVYGIISTSTVFQQDTISLNALYGLRILGDTKTGLYIADHGHYLAIAGDSYLSGDCFLPKLGGRKAYIDGRSFRYSRIVDGSILQSKSELPRLQESFISYCKDELFNNSMTDQQVSENALNSDDIVRSFTEPSLHIHSTDAIRLDKLSLAGNIIVQSDTKIVIDPNAELDQVICVAPNIYISSGFEGRIQCFAIDTLVVESGVRLKYPAAVAVMGFERSTALLKISEDAVVEGGVLVWAEMEKGEKAELEIDPGARISGIAYSSGTTEHRGRITGSLFCDKLVLQTRQGYYENHLLDAWVDPLSIEPSFGSAISMQNIDENNKQIIKWLN